MACLVSVLVAAIMSTVAVDAYRQRLCRCAGALLTLLCSTHTLGALGVDFDIWAGWRDANLRASCLVRWFAVVAFMFEGMVTYGAVGLPGVPDPSTARLVPVPAPGEQPGPRVSVRDIATAFVSRCLVLVVLLPSRRWASSLLTVGPLVVGGSLPLLRPPYPASFHCTGAGAATGANPGSKRAGRLLGLRDALRKGHRSRSADAAGGPSTPPPPPCAAREQVARSLTPPQAPAVSEEGDREWEPDAARMANSIGFAHRLPIKVYALFLCCYVAYFSVPKAYARWQPRLHAGAILFESFEQWMTLLLILIHRLAALEERDALKARLRMEHEKAAAQQRSADARKLFLRYVFHEVRVPFNSLKLGLQLLAASPSLQADGEAFQTLGMMRSSADAMTSTMNSVLQLSAMESGAFKVNKKPANPRSMLHTIRHSMQPWASDSNTRLDVGVDADVPPSLLLDEPRLGQVVSNFVSNALKFVPQDASGRVTVRARMVTRRGDSGSPRPAARTPGVGPAAVASDGTGSGESASQLDGGHSPGPRAGQARCAGQLLRIEVTDNGVGISPEEQAKLFVPFHQINSGDNVKKVVGTGLGLAIAKEIAAQHGGSVGVESALGQGSTFWLEVPATPAPPPPPIAGTPLPQLADPPQPPSQSQSHVPTLDPPPSHKQSSPVHQLRGSADFAQWGDPDSAAAPSPLINMTGPWPGAGTGLPFVGATGLTTALAAADTGRTTSGAETQQAQQAQEATGQLSPGAATSGDGSSFLHLTVPPPSSDSTMGPAPEHTPAQANAAQQGNPESGRPRQQLDGGQAAAQLQAGAEAAAQGGAHSRPRAPLRFLVVDDDRTTVRMMSRMLARRWPAASIASAFDGREALAQLRAAPAPAFLPTHILLDGAMPVMDGYKFATALRDLEAREGWPHVTMLGCTGNALEEDQEAFIAAGADAVVIKPISLQALEAAVERPAPATRRQLPGPGDAGGAE